jgi:uncharacterized membrane protein
MINWKATLVFLCIFLAGGVAGGFVGNRIACTKANKQTPAPAQNPQRRPIDEWSKRLKKEFITRLSITPEQEASLDPIFQEAQAELRVHRELFSKQAGAIMERLDGKLMTTLTPEQKLKYEELIKERQERQKKMEADRAAAAARGDNPAKPGGSPQPSSSPDKQPQSPTSTADKIPTPASSEAAPPKAPAP